MERTKFLIVDLAPFSARLKEVTAHTLAREYGLLKHRLQRIAFERECDSLQTWLIKELLEAIYLVQVLNHARDEYYDFEQQVRDLYPRYETDFTSCFQPYFRSLTELPDRATVNYVGQNLVIINDDSFPPIHRRIKNLQGRKHDGNDQFDPAYW